MKAQALAIWLLGAVSAQAQIGALPLGVEDGLAALGPVVDPARTAALLAPFHQPFPRPGVREVLDQAYGPDPRQQLDIFVAETPGPARPILVFVHGGAFTGGDKRSANGFAYQNIGAWAVGAGMVGINVTYRLAPAHPWPAAAEDLAAAIGWIRARAPDFGGNPDRIILVGHSAGAAHAAAFAATGEGIAGLVLISGLYDIAALPPSPGIEAYYGTDRSFYAERGSLEGLAATDLPIMQATAALDPPGFLRQGEALQAALCARPVGCAPAMARLPGHNHLSTVFAIGTADRELSDAIAGFVQRLR
ncbi:alpha/beta hydrolase [Humitalea sp. 24SJ18S-53]|uniref:alpha/beta hydrolase n=1 Tax=Humitalea sp. 24SJ18S-53 TaxID=3422307 RepID=UPI003D66B2CA